MAKRKPVFNEAGTHVFVRNTESGDEWECPAGYLPVALTHGFELAEPRDRSLDGLFDQTGFDPAEHTVEEVNAHLEQHAVSSPGEVARVLALEEAGQARKTIVDPRIPAGDEDSTDPNPGE